MDNSEFLVGSRAYIYLGLKGAVAPIAIGPADLPEDPIWRNVGFTTADSVSFNTEPQFVDIMSAQSDYKTGRIQTSDAAKLSAVMQQWNAANLIASFGGGTVTGTAGSYKFTPPRIGERNELAALLHIVNGADHYLWVCPQVFQGEGVPLELNRSKETGLPLMLDVLGSDILDAWYLLSNDESMAPAGP